MKRLLSFFLCLLSASILFAESAPLSRRIECGNWYELKATPYEDYHFVEWNDHNTDSVRSLQANENATHIAFFAANCEEYANWPVLVLHDWLLMLNVQAINEMGYYVAPTAVTWYRVVGTPDDMHNAFPQDDQCVGSGYYLSIEQNRQGVGAYYAVADVSDAQGMLCDGLMRSTLVNYALNGQEHRVMLIPNHIFAGDEMQLVGLNPSEESHIRVYSSTGQLLADYTSTGSGTYLLQGAYVAGCYQVQVKSPTLSETLRYMVKK